MREDLQLEHPVDEDVDAPYPDTIDQEGVHLLANQARERPEGERFSDEQVFEWAAAFIAEDGSGTVDGLIDYIRRQQGADQLPAPPRSQQPHDRTAFAAVVTAQLG